jgi:hypothetical protein
MSWVNIDRAEVKYSEPSGGIIHGVMKSVNIERNPKKATTDR